MRKLKNYKPTRFMEKTSRYDADAADYAVMFIESLCHTKGAWARKPFELIDWQEQIIRDIFGVLKPNGYRQFNTAYIEIPKKQGKSELAAAVALLLTCGDGEERAEVYKYSFAGQEMVSADASELTITNPTAFESKPYIKLYGSGTVALMIQPQDRGMMISDLDEYIEIDSELMNCFKDTILKNDTVKGAEFPVFKPGTCTINCTGDVTRIEVIPRWCCL